jgi:hypothetical protein
MAGSVIFAPVTTSLLLPGNLAVSDLPVTFSEAGVGADGRTTYVGSLSTSGKVEMSA